ncbi:MAG: antibiotic biosynthesis monooxygenase family protein [Chitinophagaceae bacterium]
MITISKEKKYLTLINVFTVEAENQGKLLNLLKLATESTVSKVAGFISASLHRGIDGSKVTMYAQWESIEAYQNMRNNSAASPFLDEALKIARFEPGMYEVSEIFVRSDQDFVM